MIKALATEVRNYSSRNKTVLALMRKQLPNLLLIPLEAVDMKKAIASFGMDSMITAEYRTWFWTVFKVDIQFLDILSSINTLQSLTDMVERELMGKIED